MLLLSRVSLFENWNEQIIALNSANMKKIREIDITKSLGVFQTLWNPFCDRILTKF